MLIMAKFLFIYKFIDAIFNLINMVMASGVRDRILSFNTFLINSCICIFFFELLESGVLTCL